MHSLTRRGRGNTQVVGHLGQAWQRLLTQQETPSSLEPRSLLAFINENAQHVKNTFPLVTHPNNPILQGNNDPRLLAVSNVVFYSSSNLYTQIALVSSLSYSGTSSGTTNNNRYLTVMAYQSSKDKDLFLEGINSLQPSECLKPGIEDAIDSAYGSYFNIAKPSVSGRLTWPHILLQIEAAIILRIKPRLGFTPNLSVLQEQLDK